MFVGEIITVIFRCFLIKKILTYAERKYGTNKHRYAIKKNLKKGRKNNFKK